RRATFHASQSGQTCKGFGIKPLLRALAPEMQHQEIDFSLQGARRDRDIEIGLTHVSIPFGNLVLENAVIAEGIPSQTAHLAVVLMCVVSAVCEDQVRIDAAFKILEP